MRVYHTSGLYCYLSMLICATFAPTDLLGMELLVNGGAESGDLSGWVATGPVQSVTSVRETAGTVLPFDGSNFFAFTEAPANSASLIQQGPFDFNLDKLKLTGWIQTELNDEGVAELSLLNSQGQVVDFVRTDVLNTPNLIWEPFNLEIDVPNQAETWEVQLSGTLRSGSFVNVFWDNIILAANAEPTAHFCLTATAIGSQNITPNTTSPLTNGDFSIRRNSRLDPNTDLVGDGANEQTEWIFDFTTDPEYDTIDSLGLIKPSALMSAEFTITITPDEQSAGLNTDSIAIFNSNFENSLGENAQIVDIVDTLPPLGEPTEISFDLLEFYTADEVITLLLESDFDSNLRGGLVMHYGDDALVSFSELKLTFIPEPTSAVILGMMTLSVIRRRAA